MADRDYYEILELDKNATEKDIKMAFKKMARKYHPDVAENKEEAEIKFREINEAYSILSDPEKKSLYDQFGHAGVKRGAIGDSPFGGGFGDMSGFGFGDMFDMFAEMGGFGTGFSGGRRGTRSRATRGRDIRHDVKITLEEAFKGKDMPVEVEILQNCPVCNGRRVKPGVGFTTCGHCKGSGVLQNIQRTVFGQFITTSTCPHCGGEGQTPNEKCEECKGQGRVLRTRKIDVRIPAGVDDGMRIRIPGEGEGGEYGGPNGDLYVFIHVKKHKVFQRQGNDLFMDLKIGFVDASLGTEKEIETLEGKEKIFIEPGTQYGSTIRLKNQGMPDVHRKSRGDLIVTVKVVTPTKLSDRQKQLLKDFCKEGPQFHYQDKGIFEKIIDAIKGKT